MTTRRSISNRPWPARRGVTLLFVVSMIVLFLLMGTTFVIVANSFSVASKKRERKRLFTIAHQPVIEHAF